VTRLRLTFACGNYDRMAALRTGDVCIEGIDLTYVAIDSPREIFDRMGGRQEFDLAEFSSSEFISRFVRGDYSLVALPVFPSRVFRHGHIYINRRSGLKHPKDLEHRRVGVALYTQTAAVWIRGHPAHQYGSISPLSRGSRERSRKAVRTGTPARRRFSSLPRSSATPAAAN
jgi:4,5-dihydroxyphthalate decarboxylase